MRAEVFRSLGRSLLRSPRLWLIQVLVNPLLGAAFAVWLLIPEARAWQLAVSVVLIAAIFVATLVLQGGTLNYLHSAEQNGPAPLKPAFVRALKNAVALAVWVAVFYFLWAQIDTLDYYREIIPDFVRSELPQAIRNHLSLDSLTSTYSVSLFMLRWTLLPGLLLPGAALAAGRGFRGFERYGISSWWGTVRSGEYWLALIVATLLGVLGTGCIVSWHPAFLKATLHLEIISAAFRFFAAYIIALASWMLAASAVGGGRIGFEAWRKSAA